MENFPLNFVSVFLQLHNEYRVFHDASPLQIDDKLNDYAQEWANVLAENRVLQYRSESEYGENIYVSSWRSNDREIKPTDPLQAWYREGRFFKYGEEQPLNLENVRHFTQLIWKGSKAIGMGLANDSMGSFYFVCNYKPRGNVEGKFAANVLPMKQDDRELLPREAEKIRIIKSRPDVVKSMERLYAVPSEKLRVWTIWLSKVGEIADEWQRWLRAHIDLTLRLADRLQAAERAVRKSKAEEVAAKKVASSRIQASTDNEEEYFDAIGDLTQEDEEIEKDVLEYSLEGTPEESEATLVAKSDATVTQSEITVIAAPRKESSIKSKITVTTVPIDVASMIWPIGSPWQHMGLEDIVIKEPFEKLPLPSNEQEMREFLNKFTHQATVYRSYYKHWMETADQATKEIGGRLVLATYKVQGKDGKTGRIKLPPCPKPFRMEKKASPKQPSVKSIKSVDEQTGVSSATLVPTPVDEENKDVTSVRSGKSKGPSTLSIKTRSATKVSKESQKSIDVADWIRECARAMEPLPYIFYLKTEPDIDIAIEHDDGEVILTDLDRENVVANYKRYFFNLKDKPHL